MQAVDKDNNIIISKGDILNVTFKVNGLSLGADDKIYFSVKDRLSDENVLISHNVTNIDVDTNRFTVVVPTEIMSVLEVGQYFYDLTKVSAGNQRTLNFPTKLIIKEVAHNGNFND